MTKVRNDTGFYQNLVGQNVAPGAIIEVRDVHAVALSKVGWSLVSEVSGYKRGLILEDYSAIKPIESYVLDSALGLPRPTGPFEFGKDLEYPMAGNDTIGDCTIAGIVHGMQVSAEIAGVSYPYVGDAVVESFYYYLTGGQDTGLELTTVIQACSKPNLLGFEIAGIATVDILDFSLVNTALYNFGWLYLAIECPESAEMDFDKCLPWRLSSPASPSAGGHCIVAIGDVQDIRPYTQTPVIDLVTWGSVTDMTKDFWLYYGVEAFVVVPTWYFEKGLDAIQNLDKAQLLADLATIRKST